MKEELERTVNAYAHDYRNMCMNEEELTTMLKNALVDAYEIGCKTERAFILNVLDGVDIADGECNTKAIRFALQSRII